MRGDCHYCGGTANTLDHIVPRQLLRLYRERKTKEGVQPRIRNNTVASCGACNNRKANMRSDCFCDLCIGAWMNYGPPGWASIPIVNLTKVA